MTTKTFTFRVDKDTKQIMKSYRFKKRYGSVNTFLQKDFEAVLDRYFAQFWGYGKVVQMFLPNHFFMEDLTFNQKVSIQIDLELKAKLEHILSTDEHVPYFMQSLSKFCQWSVIIHAQAVANIRVKPPRLVGPPLIGDANHAQLDVLMVFTTTKTGNNLFVPALRKTYEGIQTRYDLMAVLRQLNLDISQLCHGLGPNEFPSDNWMLDYQLKTNQTYLHHYVDMKPYWNHDK